MAFTRRQLPVVFLTHTWSSGFAGAKLQAVDAVFMPLGHLLHFARQDAGAPAWVTAPNTIGPYVVAGVYPAQAGTVSYQHKMAQAAGYDELANKLHKRLQPWLQREAQQAGLTPGDIPSLAREISAACIREAREEATWQTASKTLYIKISIDPTQVKDVAIEAYTKFIKARPDLWKQATAQRTEADFISALQATANSSLAR